MAAAQQPWLSQALLFTPSALPNLLFAMAWACPGTYPAAEGLPGAGHAGSPRWGPGSRRCRWCSRNGWKSSRWGRGPGLGCSNGRTGAAPYQMFCVSPESLQPHGGDPCAGTELGLGQSYCSILLTTMSHHGTCFMGTLIHTAMA